MVSVTAFRDTKKDRENGRLASSEGKRETQKVILASGEMGVQTLASLNFLEKVAGDATLTVCSDTCIDELGRGKGPTLPVVTT